MNANFCRKSIASLPTAPVVRHGFANNVNKFKFRTVEVRRVRHPPRCTVVGWILEGEQNGTQFAGPIVVEFSASAARVSISMPPLLYGKGVVVDTRRKIIRCKRKASCVRTSTTAAVRPLCRPDHYSPDAPPCFRDDGAFQVTRRAATASSASMGLTRMGVCVVRSVATSAAA